MGFLRQMWILLWVKIYIQTMRRHYCLLFFELFVMIFILRHAVDFQFQDRILQPCLISIGPQEPPTKPLLDDFRIHSPPKDLLFVYGPNNTYINQLMEEAFEFSGKLYSKSTETFR